jgi:hypothetical protein
MAVSPSSESSPSSRESLSEAEAVLRILGTDPWMRFDMWAARAWNTAEQANQLALSTAPPISSDDAVFDPRVAALFHASELAKEFAEMLNPLTAVCGGVVNYETESSEDMGITITTVVESEDTE